MFRAGSTPAMTGIPWPLRKRGLWCILQKHQPLPGVMPRNAGADRRSHSARVSSVELPVQQSSGHQLAAAIPQWQNPAAA